MRFQLTQTEPDNPPTVSYADFRAWVCDGTATVASSITYSDGSEVTMGATFPKDISRFNRNSFLLLQGGWLEATRHMRETALMEIDEEFANLIKNSYT